MEKLEVESSNVKEIEYDHDRNELYITYIKGGRYKYSGFLPSTWEELKKAPSKGKFIHSRIRNGGYTFKKV
jgi:hypothetical protein